MTTYILGEYTGLAKIDEIDLPEMPSVGTLLNKDGVTYSVTSIEMTDGNPDVTLWVRRTGKTL